MDDKMRALLGDHEAAKRLTEAGVLLPCAHCGAAGKRNLSGGSQADRSRIADKMSMTRREAAIKSCEDRIRHLESVPPHYYGKRQRGRAIELEKVKIKALRPVSREQVERVRGEWINTNKEVEQMCKCSKCGYPISYFWSRTPFCPNCGAPMTDEAVDIRLKELEALKDGKGD